MGQTIPSFRIASGLEEKNRNSQRYLTKKDDKKAFNDMFSIARLYNSACSYATNHPIRIYHIKILFLITRF
jgi:hypothetical protein